MVKYLTTADLRSVPTQWWYQTGVSQSRIDRLCRELDPDLRYPVMRHFDHNDGRSVRCGFGLANGHTFYLDIPHSLFQVLGEADV
jgi:hypothetical protein